MSSIPANQNSERKAKLDIGVSQEAASRYHKFLGIWREQSDGARAGMTGIWCLLALAFGRRVYKWLTGETGS